MKHGRGMLLAGSALALSIGAAGALAVADSGSSIPAGTGTPYLGHPLNVPATPVANVSECPADPGWSIPLPPGAVVTRTLGTGTQSGTVTVNGIATTHTDVGRCEYEVSLPG